ncbi:MAG: AsmA family protein [Candidatus Omnitrophica bacterium]|nr:AsmA family protein [Candidatus Omnitrophota bacterium]
MVKSFNVKGIAILLTILAIIHFGFAFFISPLLKNIVIETINKQAGTKILIANVTVWPLTLSCTLKDLKVFDPDDASQRIVAVKNASLRVSLLALLSKRIVVSDLRVVGAQIDLKGEADGSFNIQKIVPQKDKKEKSKTDIIAKIKTKKDWFSRIYDLLKKQSAKKSSTKSKGIVNVKREVQPLPQGRRVLFVKPSDQYLFEIKNLTVKNSSLKLEDDAGKTLNIDQATINIKNIVLDPSAGGRFDKLRIQGIVTKNNQQMGDFSLNYDQDIVDNVSVIRNNFTAKDIDLLAIESLYRDSLPVQFSKGTINITSQTVIQGDVLDSQNSLTLQNHTMNAKQPNQMVASVIPASSVCNALNQINPVEMKFQITGSVEHPEFKGFQEMLLKIVKPYLKSLGETAVKDGIKNALGGFLKDKSEPSTEEVDNPAKGNTEDGYLKSIKSIFGDKK